LAARNIASLPGAFEADSRAQLHAIHARMAFRTLGVSCGNVDRLSDRPGPWNGAAKMRMSDKACPAGAGEGGDWSYDAAAHMRRLVSPQVQDQYV
jgi:hypothetical protein